MITIIIPSRSDKQPDGSPGVDELFLARTVNDILANARGDIEIMVALDGYWPDPEYMPADDKRVKYLHFGQASGMRRATNAVAEIASGEYLMKVDSHCAFSVGFDVELAGACEPNWVMIPRRYSLEPDKWEPYKRGRDYMYLTYPERTGAGDWGGSGFHGYEWPERDRDPAFKHIEIDEIMSFQGSCWIMHRDYFKHLGLMDIENYGPFWQEAQDIGFKVWLDGGRIMRNKRCWYAHLHKGKRFGRGFFIRKNSLQKPVEYTKQLVRENREALTPVFEKFQPIPGWPVDWKDQIFD